VLTRFEKKPVNDVLSHAIRCVRWLPPPTFTFPVAMLYLA
jgi:hypothetical protein